MLLLDLLAQQKSQQYYFSLTRVYQTRISEDLYFLFSVLRLWLLYFYLGKRSNLWVIMEYCPHGNLRNLLRSSRNFYDVDEETLVPDSYGSKIGPKSLMYFSWQIANGLAFLSSRKVEKKTESTVKPFVIKRPIYLPRVYISLRIS